MNLHLIKRLDTSQRLNARVLCPTFFIKVFAELFTKSDRFSFYLRPSLLGGFLNRNSNRNSHTNHGVVT